MTLGAHGGSGYRLDLDNETYIPTQATYWDGSDVADCLDVSHLQKQQAMPEKRRFQAVIALSAKDHGADAMEDCSPTLRAGGHTSSHANAGVMPAVATHMAVRRLTPRECERLQGFPDDYTLIDVRKHESNCNAIVSDEIDAPCTCGRPCKPAADGPRYKALGNSMAVPVMRYIGERIQAVERIPLSTPE